MTDKTKIIVVSVVSGILVLGAFTGGWWGSRAFYSNKKPVVVVKPNGPGTTTVINTPSTPEDLLKWKNAPLKITGRITSKDNLLVECGDGFKSATQNFKIGIICPEEGKNVIMLNYVGGFDYRSTDIHWSHGASLGYYRMLIPYVGIGAQLVVTERNIMIQPGLLIKF